MGAVLALITRIALIVGRRNHRSDSNASVGSTNN